MEEVRRCFLPASRTKSVVRFLFRPSGAGSFSRPLPRLAPWAAFFRRFAALIHCDAISAFDFMMISR